MGVIPAHMILELCKLYAEGEPVSYLMERYDTSLSTVLKHVRRAGLPRRNIYQTKWTLEGGSMRPWIYQNEELESLVIGGYSESEIAVRLRRSRDATRHQIRYLGFPSSNAVNTELFFVLLKSGISPARCTELIGCSVGEGRLPATADQIEIIQLYNSIRATNLVIAETLGVSKATVYRWRREYEISKKPSVYANSKGYNARKDVSSRILPDGAGGIS